MVTNYAPLPGSTPNGPEMRCGLGKHPRRPGKSGIPSVCLGVMTADTCDDSRGCDGRRTSPGVHAHSGLLTDKYRLVPPSPHLKQLFAASESRGIAALPS